VPRNRLHGEQAAIEVYRGAGKGDATSSSSRCTAVRDLAPGASMSFEQTFELLDYDGLDPAGQWRGWRRSRRRHLNGTG